MKAQKIYVYYNIFLIANFLLGCSLHGTTTQPEAGIGTQTPNQTSNQITATSIGHDDKCLGALGNLPNNINGRFVLSENYHLYRPGLELHQGLSYIFAPITEEKIPLYKTENQNVSEFFSVAPNKERLAYLVRDTDMRNGWLIIVENNGKPAKQYYYYGWDNLVWWVNDRQILVSKLAEEYPFITIAFDTINEKEEELLPNYPNIDRGETWGLPSWNEYFAVMTVYSHDLNFVIYPKSGSDIILWDRKNQKTITEFSAAIIGENPLWLSDGQAFIIPASVNSTEYSSRELMRIGVDGQTTQLTNLGDSYKSSAVWAPRESFDGRYIAFWFKQNNTDESKLAVYSTLTGTTSVFCVNGGGYVGPVWSPDGHQLLVDGFFDNIDNYSTVFVDIEKGLLATVKKGVIPVGWMVSP